MYEEGYCPASHLVAGSKQSGLIYLASIVISKSRVVQLAISCVAMYLSNNVAFTELIIHVLTLTHVLMSGTTQT